MSTKARTVKLEDYNLYVGDGFMYDDPKWKRGFNLVVTINIIKEKGLPRILHVGDNPPGFDVVVFLTWLNGYIDVYKHAPDGEFTYKVCSRDPDTHNQATILGMSIKSKYTPERRREWMESLLNHSVFDDMPTM